ncbi:MAG: hypothetical protein HN737_12785 [Desulfobacterales bacterium]|jgi:hypothetical protein|nr:hypothetical protein [Desulfobacteraceae bacterium]MBT4363068.1 hypothetical protein [Desulfobacteraceae bacterium]MBT7084874.1 hypothetical protein [Desulfobacterales bacterium]MBT7698272.1 hypothetical protein [Desulfobacterales bacterium]
MTGNDIQTDLNKLIEEWIDTPEQTKKAFLRLKKHLESQSEVKFDFNARPGISYSLRATHNKQKRQLYVMLDIIDDDPENRWLSICFYGEMITDPDEVGDLVPEGLLGEDGHCFDVDDWDENNLKYLEARLDEAHQNASEE